MSGEAASSAVVFQYLMATPGMTAANAMAIISTIGNCQNAATQNGPQAFNGPLNINGPTTLGPYSSLIDNGPATFNGPFTLGPKALATLLAELLPYFGVVYGMASSAIPKGGTGSVVLWNAEANGADDAATETTVTAIVRAIADDTQVPNGAEVLMLPATGLTDIYMVITSWPCPEAIPSS